jgi:ribosomal protein S14
MCCQPNDQCAFQRETECPRGGLARVLDDPRDIRIGRARQEREREGRRNQLVQQLNTLGSQFVGKKNDPGRIGAGPVVALRTEPSRSRAAKRCDSRGRRSGSLWAMYLSRDAGGSRNHAMLGGPAGAVDAGWFLWPLLRGGGGSRSRHGVVSTWRA